MSLVTLFVLFVVACLIYWALTTVMDILKVPEQMRALFIVVYVVIVVLLLLGLLTGHVSLGSFRFP